LGHGSWPLHSIHCRLFKYRCTTNNSYWSTVLTTTLSVIVWSSDIYISYFFQLRRRIESRQVMFGCLDTWLLWQLTGKRVFASEYSCASSTVLFDPYQVRCFVHFDLFSVWLDIVARRLSDTVYASWTNSDAQFISNCVTDEIYMVGEVILLWTLPLGLLCRRRVIKHALWFMISII